MGLNIMKNLKYNPNDLGFLRANNSRVGEISLVTEISILRIKIK